MGKKISEQKGGSAPLSRMLRLSLCASRRAIRAFAGGEGVDRALMDNRVGPAVMRLMKEAAKDASEFAALCRKIDLLADGEVDLEEVRNDFLTDRASEICELPDFKVASVIEVGRMEEEVLLGSTGRFFIAAALNSF